MEKSEEYNIPKSVRQLNELKMYADLMGNHKKQRIKSHCDNNVSAANSMRMFRAYVSSVKDELGQGFIAALRHIIHYLNGLMQVILKAASAFRIFMETLFGRNISGGSRGAVIDTSDFEDASDYLDDASTAADDTASGIGQAADSAEKLKKELSVLPFDELNQLNKDQERTSTSTGTGGTGGGTGGAGGLADDFIGDTGLFDLGLDQLKDKLSDAEQFISDWARRLKVYFKSGAWDSLGKEIAWGINKGIDKLYDILDPAKVREKVDPYIDAFTTTLNSLVDAVHWDTMGSTMARGLNNLLYIANRVLGETDWNNLGSKIAEWANALVHDVEWDELGRFFALKLNVFWETAQGFFRDFDFAELGQQMADGLWGFVSNINYDAIVDVFIDGLQGLSDALINFGATFPWGEAVDLLVSHVNDFIDGLPTDELGEAVGGMINHLTDTIIGIVDPDTGINFEELGSKLGSGLMKMIMTVKPQNLAHTIEVIFSAAWTMFRGFISELDTVEIGNRLVEVFGTLIRDLKPREIATDLKGFVKKILDMIKIFFGSTDLWEGLGAKIGEGISTFLGDRDLARDLAEALNAITSALVSLLEGAINALTDDKNRGKIETAFKTFFGTIKWGDVVKLVWPLIVGHLIVGLGGIAFTGLKRALINQFTVMFGELASNTAVRVASGGVFKQLVTTLGAAGIEGTVIGAVVLATAELQKFNETLRGGNGFLTENGGAIDSFISKMGAAGVITGETHEKLFQLKEEWENGTLDDSQFFSQFAAILDDAGINAEQARTYVEQLAGQINLTDDQIQFLNDTIDQMSAKTGESREAFKDFGIDTESAITGTTTAVGNAYQALGDAYGEVALDLGDIRTKFTEAMKGGADFGTQLDLIAAQFAELPGGVDALRQAIDDQLGEGAFDSFTHGAYLGAESVDGIHGSLTTAGEKAEQLAGKMDTVGEHAEAAQGKLDSAETSAEGVNSTVEESPSLFDTLRTIASGFFSNLLTLFPTGNQYSDKMKPLFTAIQNAFVSDEASTAQEKYDGFIANLATAIDDANLGDKAKTKTEEVPEGVSDVMTGTKADKAVADTDAFIGRVHNAVGNDNSRKFFEESESASENIPKGIAKGLEDNGRQVESAAERLANIPKNIFVNTNRIHSPSELFKELAGNIGAGIAEGLQNSVSTVTYAMNEIMDSIRETFTSNLSGMQMDAYNSGNDLTQNGLLAGIRNGFNDFDLTGDVRNILQAMTYAISEASWSFYDAGKNLGEWFASGFSSVHIPVPNLYVWNWDTIYNADGSWYTLPRYAVNWNAKGGLFTRASVLQGFGEDGDEAALPLERKSTMERIASAIMDNYHEDHGLTKEDVMEAVAYALATNSQNQPPINVYSTLYTEDNEVLARAVQRGNQSIDYRNNATPKYSY